MTEQPYHEANQSSIGFASASNPVRAAIARRTTKRAAIEQFFAAHIGQLFPSSDLHAKYGSAFRTRVSDINRDPAASVTIRNSVTTQSDGSEISAYWAEVRA